jgi:TPR repeat protein
MVTKANSGQRRVFLSTLKEARIGAREAQYELGLMYAHGQGVAQDLDEALLWVTKAAERGLPAAQYLLASRMLGETGNASPEAVWWYLRAADQGHSRALFKLGKLWSSAQPGIAVAKLEASAAQGLADAQFACGQAAAREQPPDYGAALIYYRQAAEQNFAPAVSAIGDIYEAGLGVVRDIATAQSWYRRAVGLGWPAAQIALAALDSVAEGREVRSKKARRGNTSERRRDDNRWLKVEERGDAQARFHLAQMYEQGIGIEADAQRALNLYRVAAKQGDAQAQLALARIARAQHDPQALDWYEKAARNGNAAAQCVLGEHHVQGTDQARDVLQGLHWYLRAMEQGYTPAMKGLHDLLEQGAPDLALAALRQAALGGDVESQYLLAQRCAQGPMTNMVDAVRWWEAAAAQGYAPAQCAIGLQWLSGRHLERNVAKAVDWLQLAAEQNDTRAQWNLGSLYASGAPGVAKDLIQAFECCHRAANLEFVPAQATLGVLYARMGESAKALHWWGLAAENGDAEAQFNLATVLLAGADGKPDVERAFHWFHAAACQGLAPAQSKLAVLYATGQGVALDAIEAHKWFVLAARHGDRAAQDNVKRSADKITGVQQREAVRRADAFRPDKPAH